MKDYKSIQSMLWDFMVLDDISKNENLSQRDLARRTGMALGRTNQVVKRLVRKGLVKTRQINAKRVAYYLTPKGFSEKLRLVVEYTQISINLFTCVRQVVNQRLKEMIAKEGIRTVAVVGTGEVGEAAYLSIQEAGLELAAVYDVRGNRSHWFGRNVHREANPQTPACDVVIVSEMEAVGEAIELAERVGGQVVEIMSLLPEGVARFGRRVVEDDPSR